MSLTLVDLFSGIGGFSLAGRWAGFETVAFCEIEPYCQKVLRKHWPDVPIHDDVRTFPVDAYRGCTLLTGGFPCQPFSVAGKRRGKEDDRYLWPAMLDVIRQVEPRWVVAENVPGFLRMGLSDCLTDLEGAGYKTGVLAIPACGVGAPHRRERLWIVAQSEQFRRGGWGDGDAPGDYGEVQAARPRSADKLPILADAESREGGRILSGRFCPDVGAGCEDDADAEGECGQLRTTKRERPRRLAGRGNGADADSNEQGPQGHGRLSERPGEWLAWKGSRSFQGIWKSEPAVGRVATGVSARVDRLKGLGNAIVPQVAYPILRAIADICESYTP